jgi:hypothetical protein
MSLLEAEHRRSQRARRKHRKQQHRKQKARSVGIGHNLGPSLAPLLDDRVLTHLLHFVRGHVT